MQIQNISRLLCTLLPAPPNILFEKYSNESHTFGFSCRVFYIIVTREILFLLIDKIIMKNLFRIKFNDN